MIIKFVFKRLLSADVDLVVHAAGPFQQAEKCTVLEAALQTKVRNVTMATDCLPPARKEIFCVFLILSDICLFRLCVCVFMLENRS